jgi:hypothetical protein
MRPQSAIVEVSDFGKGVEAAAMGVAGEILKVLQFTKDREIGVCAENAFQLGLDRRSCYGGDVGAGRMDRRKWVA